MPEPTELRAKPTGLQVAPDQSLRHGVLALAISLYAVSFLLPAWDNREASWNHMSFSNPPGAGSIVYGFQAFVIGLGAMLLLIPAWLANPFFIGGCAALYWKKAGLATALGGVALLLSLTGLMGLLREDQIHEHRFLSGFHVWTAAMAVLAGGAGIAVSEKSTSRISLRFLWIVFVAVFLLLGSTIVAANVLVSRLVHLKFGQLTDNDLVHQLESRDPKKRAAALHALDRVALSDSALRSIVAGLVRDESPEVRRAAVKRLVRFSAKPADAIPALRQALTDPHPGVRVAAAGAHRVLSRL